MKQILGFFSSSSTKFLITRSFLAAIRTAAAPLSLPRRLPITRRTLSVIALNATSSNAPMTDLPKGKSENEWRAVLSPEQFRVLRQKGTERAGTGEYEKVYEEGVYTCAGCATPLYKSKTKFDSGCGWPAFYDAIPGAVSRHEDRSLGVVRTEIICTTCGGHLGHVFKGEKFKTPTDERHCVNSVSLTFHDKNSSVAQDQD